MAATPWLQIAGGISAGSVVGAGYAWKLLSAMDALAEFAFVGEPAAGMCPLAQLGWVRASRYTEASASARERSRAM